MSQENLNATESSTTRLPTAGQQPAQQHQPQAQPTHQITNYPIELIQSVKQHQVPEQPVANQSSINIKLVESSQDSEPSVVAPAVDETQSSVNENDSKHAVDVAVDKNDEESEDEAENEVVEESRDGRWSKRKESVSQRDIPGIDCAYLAMDTEYGVEVVWNEIKLGNGKKFKNENLHNDEKEIYSVFKNLMSLNHPNIVKFHDYWIDKNEKDPRIIFITEYMSSGSLKQFLRKAKKTNQSIKKATWKRWCIQLLSALNYLHSCEPPIVHGNLSCDTIFIQHNGLIKIGCIAPDIVNTHVKTCVGHDMKWSRHLHFMAPELHLLPSSTETPPSSEPSSASVSTSSTNLFIKPSQMNNPAVDIYSFGMVALEMFNLEFGGNGDTHPVTPELIKQSIETLDEKQKDFVNRCLEVDPKKRPTLKDLLFHPLLFEVPSLRLLASHQLIKTQNESREISFNDSSFTRSPEFVIACVPGNHPNTREYTYSKIAPFDVNKYLEDVKNGVYPLIGLNPASSPTCTSSQKRLQSSSSLKQALVNATTTTSQVTANVDQSTTIPVSTPTVVSPSASNLSAGVQSVAQVSATNLSSASSSQTTSPSQSMSHITVHQHQPQPETLQMANYDQHYQMINTTAENMSMLSSLSNNSMGTASDQFHHPNHLQFHHLTQPQPTIMSNGMDGYPIQAPQQNSRTQSPILNGANIIVPNGVCDHNSGELIDQTDPSTNFYTSNQLEKRQAQNIDINLTLDEKLKNYMLTLTITFEDRTARLIQSLLHKTDTVMNLADELISHGLVNELDKENLCYLLSQALNRLEQNTILSK